VKAKVIPHGNAIEYHIPCPHCDSSDAVTKYLHTVKQSLYNKCFSCGKIWDDPEDNDTIVDLQRKREYKTSMTSNQAPVSMPDEFTPGDDHWGRGLTEETFNAFGVTCSEDGTNLYFPHHDYNGNLVGYKQKTSDKKFYWHGDSRRAGLFGNVLFNNTGTSKRAITVTEGQEDAMAVYQMFGSKYAAVSIVSGAESAKNLTPEDIKFLSSFEEVVICFDNDEPGRKGAKALAKSFGTGVKVSILDLALKDANEYLKAGKEDEFRRAWYNNKKPYRPDGLVYSSETQRFITEHDPKPVAYWPYAGLNELLWGIYTPGLYVITAGSGVGKTQIVKDLKYHLFNTTSDKLGEIYLEESVKQSIYQLMAIDLQKNINNPQIFDETDKQDLFKSWKRLFSDDRWMFWDHFGSSSLDSVCEQVRYLAVNFGAKYITLDHVSIIVSSQENGDERKALDEIMTRLRQLCEELDLAIFLISHLKRPNGSDSHEEGGVTSLSQLRGSAGIGQLADVVIGLERNGQHDDPFMRNVVTVRVLKSRKTGRTGPACYLLYDNDKASFTEIDKSRIEEHIEELKTNRYRKEVEETPVMDSLLGK